MLFSDTLNVLDKLSDAQAGILFKAIANFNMGKPLPKMDFALEMAFLPFENQFKRDIVKYNAICERNRKNGEKGGRPKDGTKVNPNNELYNKNPKNPVGYLETQKTQRNPKNNDKDTGTDNDKDNENDNEKVNKKNKNLKKEIQISDKLIFSLNLNGQAENFLELFRTWIEYRKEIKKPLTQRSADTAFKRLIKISEKNIEDATEIIDIAIAGSYQSFFELKKQKKFSSEKKQTGQRSILDLVDEFNF